MGRPSKIRSSQIEDFLRQGDKVDNGFKPCTSTNGSRRLRPNETWARQEVLHRMQEMPEVLEQLGLEPNVADEDILHRLKQMKDVRNELRLCDCDVNSADLLADLLPAALRAPSPQAACSCLSGPGVWLFLCASLFFLVAGLLLFLALWDTNAGWEKGTCNFDRYMQDSCTKDRCLFGGEARLEGRSALLRFGNFSLPIEPDYENQPKMRIASPAFRCCNPGGALNCCDMFDAHLQLYCDNFAHLDDSSGSPCPAGNWECLLKIRQHENGADDISELMVYEAPNVLPYYLTMGACLLCSMSCACIGTYRRGIIKCECLSCRSYLLSRFNRPEEKWEERKPSQIRFASLLRRHLEKDKEKDRLSALGLSEAEKGEAVQTNDKKDTGVDGEVQHQARPSDVVTQASLVPPRPASPPPSPPAIASPEFPKAPEEAPPVLPGAPTIALQPQIMNDRDRHEEKKSFNNYDASTEVHPSFVTGDLSKFAAQAKNASTEWFPSLAPPLQRHRKHGKRVRPASAPADALAAPGTERSGVRPASGGCSRNGERPTSWRSRPASAPMLGHGHSQRSQSQLQQTGLPIQRPHRGQQHVDGIMVRQSPSKGVRPVSATGPALTSSISAWSGTASLGGSRSRIR